MSELKVGDTIFFRGDKGEILRITHDEKEPLLEVALTRTHITYLNPSELDLYPFPEQLTLNENQQIVFENLKSNYLPKLEISGMFVIYKLMDDVIEDNWQEYSEDMPPHIKAMGNINTFKEENQVLQAFASWVLEQEE